MRAISRIYLCRWRQWRIAEDGLGESALKQRLVAILAADVAGYSRLMAANEHATVEALDAARAVFREFIASNQGRVVDMAGDSVLAVFDTASGAVTAALAIQERLAGPSQVPEERRMRFRLGIHLGDVIEKDDGSVYGDGVNIAARLEALAAPGGMAVSEAIHAAIRNRVDASFEDCGEHTVKNIPYPVHAYRLQMDGTHAAPPAAAAQTAAAGVSIAVLAFDNMSGSAEQEYFCDGICEDIVTDLSKINGIAVVGRQSSFAYKGKANDLRKVGRELGVRYLLEGSVRKAANRVRVTAQLIEAETGTHVWADRYDRDIGDTFLVGDEIAEDIVACLDIKLARGEDARVWRKAVRSPEAREVFFRGQEAYYRSTQNDIRQAREFFLETIRLEPGSAQAHASAAITHVLDVIHGWTSDPSKSLREAKRLSSKAIELDDAVAGGHYAQGVVDLFEGQHAEALEDAGKALERRPMCSGPRAGLAYIEIYSGLSDRAIQHAYEAITFNPIAPGWFLYLAAAAEYFGGRHQKALSALDEALKVNPRLLFAKLLRVGALSALGRSNQAKAEVAGILKLQPDFSLVRFAATQPFKDPAARERYLGTLREAGLPG